MKNIFTRYLTMFVLSFIIALVFVSCDIGTTLSSPSDSDNLFEQQSVSDKTLNTENTVSSDETTAAPAVTDFIEETTEEPVDVTFEEKTIVVSDITTFTEETAVVVEETTFTEESTEVPATETTEKKVTMVWISYSGKKYHSKSTCSNMNSPTQISLESAKIQGYEPCKNVINIVAFYSKKLLNSCLNPSL